MGKFGEILVLLAAAGCGVGPTQAGPARLFPLAERLDGTKVEQVLRGDGQLVVSGSSPADISGYLFLGEPAPNRARPIVGGQLLAMRDLSPSGKLSISEGTFPLVEVGEASNAMFVEGRYLVCGTDGEWRIPEGTTVELQRTTDTAWEVSFSVAMPNGGAFEVNIRFDAVDGDGMEVLKWLEAYHAQSC